MGGEEETTADTRAAVNTRSTIIPPVEEMRPGLWSIPVPIPDNPLHYVVVYALESAGGLVLLDAGWDAPESLRSLEAGMGLIGAVLADVRAMLVTHVHPDHYGLAGHVREVSGAWIGLHPADAAMIHDRYQDPTPLLADMEHWLRGADAPDDEIESLRDSSLEVLRYVRVAKPDVLIEDGDRLKVEGWKLVAVHTPGHTPGHLCFYDERAATLFTGDHVLPRITPNVAFHPQSDPDPLGDFLVSLDRLRCYGDIVAYPAHEWRFEGLQNRITELIDHHLERLERIEERVQDGAETVWEVASSLTWSRDWDRVRGFMRRAALGETWAHLILLERQSRIQAVDVGGATPRRWRLLPPPPARLTRRRSSRR